MNRLKGDPRIGKQTLRKCPVSSTPEKPHYLLENKTGSEWCTTCSYYVKDGQRIFLREQSLNG